jgi:hypothetical protein
MATMDIGNRLVWQALKLYLPPGTRLSSVYRNAQRQLDIIVALATKKGHSFASTPALDDRETWIGALRFLRSLGYKIAEPGHSAHQAGIAYDLAGPNLQRIFAAVSKAVAEKRIVLARDSKKPLRIEPVNHCVHVEIEEATLDTDAFEAA